MSLVSNLAEGGVYLLGSKAGGEEGGGEKWTQEKGEVKSMIGQRDCEGAALGVWHQVTFFSPRITAVDIAEHKLSLLLACLPRAKSIEVLWRSRPGGPLLNIASPNITPPSCYWACGMETRWNQGWEIPAKPALLFPSSCNILFVP
jgi:hypothetical protein